MWNEIQQIKRNDKNNINNTRTSRLEFFGDMYPLVYAQADSYHDAQFQDPSHPVYHIYQDSSIEDLYRNQQQK